MLVQSFGNFYLNALYTVFLFRFIFFFTQVIREQFVELHTQPIIEELGLFFQEQYGIPE